MEQLWLATETQDEIPFNLQDTGIPGDVSGCLIVYLLVLCSTQTDYETDDDPLDEVTECEELGLLLRSDFSNDNAWNKFVSNLQFAEKEFLGSTVQAEETATQDDNDVTMKEETDSESDVIPEHIIKIITRAKDISFDNISNLTALRLFNDVAIRLAPLPPPGTTRIHPSSRLIDRNKLQEVYTGKTIWIYDRRSNADESVRLVSPHGNAYGTAT